jgi:acyl-CoA hydrolase
VNFKSRIIKTGNSSIVIQVDAFKESHEEDGILACTATFTMVSVKKSSDGSYQKVNHNKSI